MTDLLRTLNRRRLIVSIVLAILFSAFTVLGYMLDESDHLHGGLLTFLGILGVGALLTPVIYGTLSALVRAERSEPTSTELMSAALRWSLIALAIAWIAWYLVLFPGVYGYDAPYWYIEHAMSDVPVRAQWSVPYSWTFWLFVETSHRLLGNYELGLAALTLLQGVLAYYAAQRMLRLIMQTGRPLLMAIATAILALVPTIPMVIFSSAQDSPFAALFVLIAVNFVELSLDPHAYWARPYALPRFALLCLAFCLVRNTGVFILGLTLLAVPFFPKLGRARLAGSIVIAIVVASIYTGPICSFLGVKRYSTIEGMSSIPDHQIIEVYGSHRDELSEADRAQIERYYNERALDVGYRMTRISDDIKEGMNDTEVEGDLMGFVGLWLRLGLRYPVDYALAAARSTIGLWYPFKSYPDELMYHPFVEPECSVASQYDERYIDIQSMSAFPAVDELLHYLYLWHNENFSRVPFLGVVSSAGLYFWLLLASIGCAISERRQRDGLVLAFFASQVFRSSLDLWCFAVM
ncbi:MAG: hypothetical protein IKG11_01420 [Atopobiaceae bacterium]|nr:hypothetical protein [Atopobiaceae bacterium]